MSDAETQGMPVRKGCLAFFASCPESDPPQAENGGEDEDQYFEGPHG